MGSLTDGCIDLLNKWLTCWLPLWPPFPQSCLPLFFLPGPDDLSNLLLIKPRLFLLDGVSGAASDGRTAVHGRLLVRRTHVQTVKGGNSQPSHQPGMRLSHRDLNNKRQAALFTGCVWGSSSFDRPYWTKDHYPAKKNENGRTGTCSSLTTSHGQ